ncbi:unnamed protein product [Paramecium sonneborni]|uniref:Uncharacterized protein n=1 Tax=Paramecium sonneborni TaxID=65129 RepID=A0A8S1MLW6_9CILI|nr:unnamed protein product [Paramecium sonneborni]
MYQGSFKDYLQNLQDGNKYEGHFYEDIHGMMVHNIQVLLINNKRHCQEVQIWKKENSQKGNGMKIICVDKDLEMVQSLLIKGQFNKDTLKVKIYEGNFKIIEIQWQ